MPEQNYQNHARTVPLYFYLAYPLIIIFIGGSVYSFCQWYKLGRGYLIPSLMVIAGISILLVAFFARSFALKAQDRAIRAEESLRYFAMTGKLPDTKLTLKQIVALRFAPNNEFVELAHRAVAENLSNADIKKSIKNWKADHDRV